MLLKILSYFRRVKKAYLWTHENIISSAKDISNNFINMFKSIGKLIFLCIIYPFIWVFKIFVK